MATEMKDAGTDVPVDEPVVQEPLVGNLTTSMTALGTAEAGTLSAKQSAIGSASVSGDADVSGSVVGMLSARGSAKLDRGCAGAVMAEGDVAVSRSGAGLIMGKRVDVEQGGGCVMIGSETEVRRGWVGLLLTRKATLSEDSRVLFDWKAALILAAVMLGLFGVILVIAFMLARRAMHMTSELRSRLPHLPELPHLAEMPHLPEWVHTLDRLRKSA
jgi:hypothetical protein